MIGYPGRTPWVSSMSSSHEWWSSTESTDRPMSFTFRRWNSGLSLATEPSSVVHIGVKSLGCENSTAHESPIHSWNRIGPSVVFAVKSGAVSPSWSPMVFPPLIAAHASSGNSHRRPAASPGRAISPREHGPIGPWSLSGSDDARAGTPGRGRGARGEIELPQDVGQVPVHRVLAQDEPPGDFRVAQPLRDELEHIEFARRQHRRGFGRRRIAEFAHEGTRTLGFVLRLHSG